MVHFSGFYWGLNLTFSYAKNGLFGPFPRLRKALAPTSSPSTPLRSVFRSVYLLIGALINDLISVFLSWYTNVSSRNFAVTPVCRMAWHRSLISLSLFSWHWRQMPRKHVYLMSSMTSVSTDNKKSIIKFDRRMSLIKAQAQLLTIVIIIIIIFLY